MAFDVVEMFLVVAAFIIWSRFMLLIESRWSIVTAIFGVVASVGGLSLLTCFVRPKIVCLGILLEVGLLAINFLLEADEF